MIEKKVEFFKVEEKELSPLYGRSSDLGQELKLKIRSPDKDELLEEEKHEKREMEAYESPSSQALIKRRSTMRAGEEGKEMEHEHPLNVYTFGRRIGLQQRFPKYERYKPGGVCCKNKEELRSQDGIIFDLMKTAGKALFEGKGTVGFVLPVRIFEPRSTIERVTDWWSTGSLYLPRAAKQVHFIYT